MAGEMSDIKLASTSSSPTQAESLSSGMDNAQDITQLARQYTAQSQHSTSHGHPFDYQPGSILDPNSDNFKPKEWTKAMLRLQEDSGSSKRRTAGLMFRNLSAYGHSAGTDYQSSLGNTALRLMDGVSSMLRRTEKRVEILRNFDGLLESGEMLVVLGPPGSGCSTFLKTITGETHGYKLTKESYINYQGVSYEQMHSHFRGEAIYTAEQDIHFPKVTVGDTLYFAARARAPRSIPGGMSSHQYAQHMRDVIMATFGIRHTINSPVGNDYVRGVSGGERKRVTIAEAALSKAPLQSWDNSTRGLDSANAIEFCKALRVETEVANVTAAVAIYQAPQAAYDLFDKATVLFEGRQIYFGSAKKAKQYFLDLGFDCAEGQTDADFLTSMTNPAERIIRAGFENKVPRTSDDFAAAWKNSARYQSLKKSMIEYDRLHPIGGDDLKNFQDSRRLQQAKVQRLSSPYTLSYMQQVQLCLWRGFVRLRADPYVFFFQLFGNFILALVIGSAFYNLQDNTDNFFPRGSLILLAVIMNAFGSALEILLLYDQRPIVEKHKRYALYHPSAEAVASMLTDMPYKILNTFTFNIPVYFMTNLRREAGPFFFFVLISFLTVLVMSKVFRTIASLSRTLHEALAPSAVILLSVFIYTGFAIPTPYILGWSKWIQFINPVSYAFEALMANEFGGRRYACPPRSLIPSYGNLPNQICGVVGSVAGENFVSGDVYIDIAYRYYASHKWRNVGIIIAFTVILLFAYLAAAEIVSPKKSKGEVLVFPRGKTPAVFSRPNTGDIESSSDSATKLEHQDTKVPAAIRRQTAIFQWHDVVYDIQIKSETRRILDHVDGWVKPGTLTALMGVSGAGKTTLLDVLASRVTTGVISGEMLVDGRQRDGSFQRKTGYVQQQDLHLETSTVREALNFSALLRQPANISKEEKLDYVNEIIKLLEMEEYADAVVGLPGEGLNVEQRKRLTIGVELAAKPQLLLFLDEPTSGLDSQTSWSILSLLEKLTRNGQAILCTIHQPSSMLFQRFDRLLLLAAGGKTVYFGEIGANSKILTNYFESNGSGSCPPGANPAEWMLEVIGAAPGTHSDIDWVDTWRNSPEIKAVHAELDNLKQSRSTTTPDATDDPSLLNEFAVPFFVQFEAVFKRIFQQHWRTPTYVHSKLVLMISSGLLISLSYLNASNTIQGLQNQMFSVFMLLTLFSQFVEQIMPQFVTQRSLYEARERQSKTYSWQAFMLSNILVELPWDLLCAIAAFVVWYYPIGFWKNAEVTDTVHERSALMFLFVFVFLVFASTFSHMLIAGMHSAEEAGNISNTVYVLLLIFCGVLVTPSSFPKFWIFLYRVSPFTYLVEGMLSAAFSSAPVVCSSAELLRFPPPLNETCSTYLTPLISAAGGYLVDPESTEACEFCKIDNTNTFLSMVSVDPANMWRDWGLMWVFVVFNIAAAVGFYWLARVPKGKKKEVLKFKEEEKA